MHWIVLVGAYITLWFLILQILLPFRIGNASRIRPPEAALADADAPPNPRLPLKALIATVAAAILWLVFYGLILAHVIDI